MNGVPCRAGATVEAVRYGGKDIIFGAEYISDGGAMMLAKFVDAGWAKFDLLRRLQLSDCALSPLGVSAIVGALHSQRALHWYGGSRPPPATARSS